jgi:murein DD-endopeptidase MepM/ murein hydrolase activator NlpD
MRKSLAGVVVLAVLVNSGCVARPRYPATPTKTPLPPPTVDHTTPTLTPTKLPTAPPTLPPAPTATYTPFAIDSTPGTPTETPIPPTRDPSLPPEHYVMNRPISSGYTDYADRTYAYGSTGGGTYRPHSGEEFRNPQGTPVVAVGDGTIQYAGDDMSTAYGPSTNFYGNLVVLQLSGYTYNGTPIFGLYGHLFKIDVQTGDRVKAGQKLGEVGSTGIAIGPHLHFEVRIGDPVSYATSTRNPDLWIRPFGGFGTVAGRVVDAGGGYLRDVALTFHGADIARYTWSYAGDENIPDEQWKENFTLGDLPAGWYTVTTRSSTQTYSVDVFVHSGHTTWLNLVLN